MRIIRNGSGYELVQLDKKLRSNVLRNLRQRNLRLMKQCIKDAEKLLEDRVIEKPALPVTNLAAALFEKLATKSFTELASRETCIVYELKEAYQAQQEMALQEEAERQVRTKLQNGERPSVEDIAAEELLKDEFARSRLEEQMAEK